MFQRLLKPSIHQSFFIFGPRGVGKTTLLQSLLPKEETLFLDLLDYDLELRLSRRPAEFREMMESLPSKNRWVVIDEVQKLPFLLDEIHSQIEKNKNRFFSLTGSSARKLKRGKANLLAGRAFNYALHPLTSLELGNSFQLNSALTFGTLPNIFSFSDIEDRKKFLRTYASTYLKEEIQMEGLTRNLQSFRRFLPLAASMNGQTLSWSNFAQDVGIDAKTVQSYFEILEDTLLGFFLPAYRRSLRKRQKTHPKFYLFDPGVKRALAGELNVELVAGTSEYGRAFEHFWILEIIRMNSYRQADFSFSYFGTHDIEIDLVIERPGKPLLFVEFKSSELIKDAELRPLKQLAADLEECEAICICREPRKRKVGKILICPWQEALEQLFS